MREEFSDKEDLIRRQDMIDSILFATADGDKADWVIGVIRSVPSAEPKKTGKWIHDGKDFPQGNDWIHCSVCGKRGINVPADLTNYCPNCGASMRGEL